MAFIRQKCRAKFAKTNNIIMKVRNLFLLFCILQSAFCIFPSTAYAQLQGVKTGDVLVLKGVRGIVFEVNDEGTHGKMMSVDGFRGTKDLYCSKASHLKKIDMQSETDGSANTKALFDYASANGISLSEFPVYQWCKSLGEGWYIPSVGELKSFINYWLGNTDTEEDWEEDEEVSVSSDDDVSHTKKVDRILLDAGGIPFINGVFTSTIGKGRKVDVFNHDKKAGKWMFTKTAPMDIDKFCVGRAFYNF